MKTAHDFLAPYVGPEPGPYLNYADAVRAVQAVIDHYQPPPAPLANVFPPACPRCTQRPDKCVCPALFPDTTPF
jgi:hypothetical protein